MSERIAASGSSVSMTRELAFGNLEPSPGSRSGWKDYRYTLLARIVTVSVLVATILIILIFYFKNKSLDLRLLERFLQTETDRKRALLPLNENASLVLAAMNATLS